MKHIIYGIAFVLAFFQMSYGACVQVRVAMLFSRPTVSSKKTWEATIYTPLKVKKSAGAWVSVSDLDKKDHWIQMKDLTNQYECATVKVAKSKLFQKSGESYIPIENLPLVKTTSFKLLSQGVDWINLEDAQGNTYWAHKKDFWIPLDAKK